MSAAAPGATAPLTTPGSPRGAADSAFEAKAFERSLGPRASGRWVGWQRQVLVFAALLGCLAVFSVARWLAAAPQLAATFGVSAQGDLVLLAGRTPALDALRGQAVRVIVGADGVAQSVDSLLLHHSLRWQADDALRARQIGQQQGLARIVASGAATLRFEDGQALAVPLAPRGYAGLGLLYWPLAGVALLLYLFAVVLVLAGTQARNLPLAIMSLCHAGNLLLSAIESAPGPAVFAGHGLGDGMLLRMLLDLATGAAVVQAFALYPRRLPRATAISVAAWCVLPLGLLPLLLGPGSTPWWWLQGEGLALCAAALVVVSQSHRITPDPYALVMRRFAMATLAALLLASGIAVLAPHTGRLAATLALTASLAWQLFFAGLLLLTPFLARSRQLLREFAMLAGISTVATSLDLLFVAVFSLGSFTSLAIAVFIALGLYAGARQWVLQHVVGGNMPSTERTFDLLYRAARDVQAHRVRHPQRLAQLLRELFEPLEVVRVDRVPVRTRVVGGGSALVVPMRSADDQAAPLPAAALVLRFAQRGRRLFTLDDARLADRVVDQLRRAVAYDAAVERGRFEERQRLAQDLHDDIGARLLTLMYQAQTPEMEDYIRHTLQDLKTLTRGLAAAEHHLSHAAAEWKADLTQRLTAAHVSLGWNFSHDRDLTLSVVQWSALTRVLRELVSNALYHGHATRVEVSFHLEGPLLTLQVADDGGGRNPQAWSHGLGLGGVRKRVKLLGGEVQWRENQPQGIVCAVRVPEFSTMT